MNGGTGDGGDVALPPSLRFLKWLVIVLTISMIAGVITVVALIVTRMPQAIRSPLPDLPASLALPAGTRAEAVTFGRGWIGVVVSGADDVDRRFLIFTPEGDLRGSVTLDTP
ncbi:MAG: hypothetical protein KF887_09125 [Paracoccaceae bacterium]|nr:MAG: hypothetical protein KF887_09125 [Paracoccaceae bacterium]